MILIHDILVLKVFPSPKKTTSMQLVFKSIIIFKGFNLETPMKFKVTEKETDNKFKENDSTKSIGEEISTPETPTTETDSKTTREMKATTTDKKETSNMLSLLLTGGLKTSDISKQAFVPRSTTAMPMISITKEPQKLPGLGSGK